jgi:3-hydroxyisobutyrate dehydrogenase-like beta-hydroxyacid dehydrogenase
VPLPVASLVASMEDTLISEGYGDEDMSNLARLVRRGAGIPDGPMRS